MKAGAVLVGLVVLAGSAACVRLGLWQTSRLEQKRALNAARARALEAPPLDGTGVLPALEALRGRRVRVRGHYDETRQILLRGREEGGLAGVEVVTPLERGDGGEAVLVNRGWLAAEDAATARPQDHPEPGEHEIVGVAEPLESRTGGPPLRRIAMDEVTVWSAAELNRDSLGALFPYRLAPFVVRELPGAGVPSAPRRSNPPPLDESMHLGYAVQWFSFAAILIGGSLGLVGSRRRRARAAARAESLH